MLNEATRNRETALKVFEAFRTCWGVLYKGNCLDILPHIEDGTVDTVFADPPFNLAKEYGEKVNDDIPDQFYIVWCKQWLDHCIRVLKPGAALFVYNMPKWNMVLGSYLTEKGLLFRHWIAVNIKFGLPISGRLYPSHYRRLHIRI